MNAKGVVIAGAVAALFLGGAAVAAETDKAGGDLVHCAGVNECKGKSSCAGGPGGNACAGMNACKGKGVADMTKAECDKKGGKVVEGMK